MSNLTSRYELLTQWEIRILRTHASLRWREKKIRSDYEVWKSSERLTRAPWFGFEQKKKKKKNFRFGNPDTDTETPFIAVRYDNQIRNVMWCGENWTFFISEKKKKKKLTENLFECSLTRMRPSWINQSIFSFEISFFHSSWHVIVWTILNGVRRAACFCVCVTNFENSKFLKNPSELWSLSKVFHFQKPKRLQIYLSLLFWFTLVLVENAFSYVCAEINFAMRSCVAAAAF